MNFTHYTLGEALSCTNETIRRNAHSILKMLQKERDKGNDPFCAHPIKKAEYINRKLMGYRCFCGTLVPVNPNLQKNKK